jgi:O-antigen ligase
MSAGVISAGVGILLYYKSINYFAARVITLYNGIMNIEQSGSVLKRLHLWQQALNISQNSTFLGDGFGKYVGTHNLFLQMAAEIGMVGALFYVLFILLRLLAVSDVYLRYTRNSRSIEADFVRMLLVAAPVNAGFALTNHNLFHFIFWFLCLATFVVEGHFTTFGRPSLNRPDL